MTLAWESGCHFFVCLVAYIVKKHFFPNNQKIRQKNEKFVNFANCTLQSGLLTLLCNLKNFERFIVNYLVD